jgi:hypothetical protein
MVQYGTMKVTNMTFMVGDKMSQLKNKEAKALEEVCEKNDLPVKIVQLLLKSAEKFSYENTSPNARKKEYLDLIDFYAKKGKGE